MSPVALELPPPREAGYRTWSSDRPAPLPVREGPAVVRTRGMSRWHRVRYGIHYPAYEITPERAATSGLKPGSVDGHTCWSFWCGPHASTMHEHRGPEYAVMRLDSLPDDGTPLCGTCEGRAIGAGHPPLAVAVTRQGGLLFAPQRIIRPKLCPSVKNYRLWTARPGWRAADCHACGEVVGLWGAGVRRHEPGPGLVEPCDLHGWKSLTRAVHPESGERLVVCRCQTTEVLQGQP